MEDWEAGSETHTHHQGQLKIFLATCSQPPVIVLPIVYSLCSFYTPNSCVHLAYFSSISSYGCPQCVGIAVMASGWSVTFCAMLPHMKPCCPS